MKLANIKDIRKPFVVAEYAKKNNFRMIDFMSREEVHFPDLVPALESCLNAAREKGCVEFCFNQIQSKYNVDTNSATWEVSIIGFLSK